MVTHSTLHNFVMRRYKHILFLHFRWLDKLGIAALTNNTRVFRQEFIGAHDSLLNATEYPLPVSLIYLGGGGVQTKKGEVERKFQLDSKINCTLFIQFVA